MMMWSSKSDKIYYLFLCLGMQNSFIFWMQVSENPTQMCLNNICWPLINSIKYDLIQRVQVHFLAQSLGLASLCIEMYEPRWLQQFWTSPLWTAMCRRKKVGIGEFSQRIKNNLSQKSHGNPSLHFRDYKEITWPM